MTLVANWRRCFRVPGRYDSSPRFPLFDGRNRAAGFRRRAADPAARLPRRAPQRPGFAYLRAYNFGVGAALRSTAARRIAEIKADMMRADLTALDQRRLCFGLVRQSSALRKGRRNWPEDESATTDAELDEFSAKLALNWTEAAQQALGSVGARYSAPQSRGHRPSAALAHRPPPDRFQADGTPPARRSERGSAGRDHRYARCRAGVRDQCDRGHRAARQRADAATGSGLCPPLREVFPPQATIRSPSLR